jgi:hypothetical protein
MYAPTYQNLVAESNEQQIVQDNNSYSSGEDLSSQFAQYGLTTDSIPY